MSGPNATLRERRERAGFSQAELAERVASSRQSINAIEVGRSTPSVELALRLARALDCSVEQLFASAVSDGDLLEVDLVGGSGGGRRLALAHIRGRWIARPLSDQDMRVSADALLDEPSGGRARVQPLRGLGDLDDNLVVEGCACALGLLADRLNARRGPGRFLWLSASSGAALRSLARGHTHLAGVHLVDGRTGEFNVPAVRRLALPGVVSLITFASWQIGLLTRHEDAGQIRGTRDLAAPGVRLVTREPDAGAQQLLERELRSAGFRKRQRKGAPVQAGSHLEVARTIALGAADAGIATEDAAIAFGLRFVPLCQERYDLVVTKALLSDPRVERWFDTLASQPLRAELESLGYDLSRTGAHVADVRSA